MKLLSNSVVWILLRIRKNFIRLHVSLYADLGLDFFGRAILSCASNDLVIVDADAIDESIVYSLDSCSTLE